MTANLSLYESDVKFFFINSEDDGILSDDMDNAREVKMSKT